MKLPSNDIFMEKRPQAWVESSPWYNVAAGLSLFLFILITICVKANVHFFTTIEDKVTATMQANFGHPQLNYQGGFLNDIMTFVASYGDIVPMGIIVLIIAAVLFFKYRKSLAIWMVGTFGVMGVVGLVLKKSIHRMRPAGHLLADDGFSFPSGHSLAATMVIWMVIMILVPRIKSKGVRIIVTLLLVILWLLILFSRLYFSAHHLGDILGGVTLSLALLWGSMAGYARFFD